MWFCEVVRMPRSLWQVWSRSDHERTTGDRIACLDQTGSAVMCTRKFQEGFSMTTALADFLREKVQGFRNPVSGSSPQGLANMTRTHHGRGLGLQLSWQSAPLAWVARFCPQHPISGVVGYIYIPGGSTVKDQKFEALLSYVIHETPVWETGVWMGIYSTPIDQTPGEYQKRARAVRQLCQ